MKSLRLLQQILLQREEQEKSSESRKARGRSDTGKN